MASIFIDPITGTQMIMIPTELNPNAIFSAPNSNGYIPIMQNDLQTSMYPMVNLIDMQNLLGYGNNSILQAF